MCVCVAAGVLQQGVLQQAQRSAGKSAMPVRRYGWHATCRHQQTLLRSAPADSLGGPTGRGSLGGLVGQLQALDENRNRSRGAQRFVMLLHSCGQMYTIHTGALQMTL